MQTTEALQGSMTPFRGRPGRLRHVELRTPDLQGLSDFYHAWGLESVGSRDGGEAETSLAFRAQGTNHHVLRFVEAEAAGLGHIAFAASCRSDVDRLCGQWDQLGVEITMEPADLQNLGGGYGFEAADPEGRRLRVITEMIAADPRPSGLALPQRLAHVVLNTVDIDMLCAFYVKVLGFSVSDWSEHQMVFLRNGSDHHSIAFNQASHASVNHIAYEVGSLDDFLVSVGRMKSAGVDPLWGIGRHGPGNNCFAYYGDPAGFVPEITADVDQIDEASWVPRVWQRVPGQSDLWHLAGPPSPEFRATAAGQPDPGCHPPRWDDA